MCENHQFQLDVLVMEFIHRDGEHRHKNNGVDCHRQLEQNSHHGIETGVEGEIHEADGEIPLLGEVDAEEIESAGTAAACQDQAAADPCEQACDGNVGKRISYERLSRDFHNGEYNGLHRHGDHGADEHFAAHGAVREQEKRNVEAQVDDTGDINRGDPGKCQRTDQLCQSDDPSGVEPERHHKEIDGAGVHGRAGHDEEYVPCGERMVRSDDRSFCLLGLAVCSFGIFDFFFHFYSMPHSLRHPREKCQNGYSPGTVCEGGRSSSRRVWNTR